MVTLMLSLLSFLVERVRHPAEKRAHAHFAHPLHHLFHFQKLLHETVHVGDRGAAPLGDASASAVRVIWPDGRSEEFTGVAAGKYTTLEEGTGR